MALPTPPAYTNPIPNNPFYSPQTYFVQGVYGSLVVGTGLNVNYSAGTLNSTGGGGGGVTTVTGGTGISVSPISGNVVVTNTGVTGLVAGSGISINQSTGNVTISSTSAGTVTSVSAGAGLTATPSPITSSGTLALESLAPSPAGSYTAADITVDIHGRVTAASSNTVITSIGFTPPITVDNSTPSAPVIGICAASTTQSGAVTLSDNVNSSSSTTAATSLAVCTVNAVALAAIPKSCITGKGSLITGTAASTPVALSPGTNGQVLYANSGAASGICWGNLPPSPSAATPTVRGTVFGCTTTGFLTGNTAALGENALGSLSTGADNTAVGVYAAGFVTTGGLNTAIGSTALASPSSAAEIENTAIGAGALGFGGGSQNTALGAYAGQSSGCTNIGGDYNTFLGHTAGSFVETGCFNVYLGACSNPLMGSTGSNNVVIGPCVQLVASNASCQLVIGYSQSCYWLTGCSNKNIKPGAGIIDRLSSSGTANQVLVSTGADTVEWKSVNSALAVPNYGSFNNTSTLTVGTVNVGQAIPLSTVSATNFSITSGSRITAAVAGTYNVQISLQIISTGGGGGDVEVWFVKNGTPISNSNTRYSVKNANEEEVAALNLVETLAAGGYIEIYWASDNSLMTLATLASTMGGPAIPSAIVTVTPVGA